MQIGSLKAGFRSVEIPERELMRLLHCPQDRPLQGPLRELVEEAKDWYWSNCRPWTYFRCFEVSGANGNFIHLGAHARLNCEVLARKFQSAQVDWVVVLAASAGVEIAERVSELWKDGYPDKSFVLDAFASGIVEQLTLASGFDLCAWGEAQEPKIFVLPHYSPGYKGWDLREQSILLDLLNSGPNSGPSEGLPGPLELLPSGMLLPQKSMIAMYGITSRGDRVARHGELCPCRQCSHPSCAYRRRPMSRTKERAAAGTSA